MKKLNDWWLVLGIAVVVAGSTFWLYTLDATASDNKVKVEKHDAILEQVVLVAESLRDPNRWLRDYLQNHDVDTSQARRWSVMPKGAVLDSKNKQLANIPYLEKHGLPEIGVMLMFTGDSTKTLDTLWTFPKPKKKK